ncbi:MAG TPA: peptide chain release factor 2 [Fimbriimonadaceae bacterium]|nr:peptide chain release factor 2 [Fimbriimonadaceae bacterium]
MKRCPAPSGGWTLSEAIFDLETLRKRISALEAESNQPGFWDDPNAAHMQLRELSRLKGIAEPLETLKKRASSVTEMLDLVQADPDEELRKEAEADAVQFLKDLDAYELKTLLSGEHDGRNALVEINAGAGGSEACDWTAILFRLYSRWAQTHDFKLEVLSETPGDVTGYRGIAFQVTGVNAYGYLKSEQGVHRLVRISPFDAAARRHTSFAKVEVLPEIEATEVDISPDDLKIETLRAGGAGGQHVNKTESAVRITHLPTGLVVTCQNERSQHKNRASAMTVLAARLAELQRAEDKDRLDLLKGDNNPAAWGRQIRSYVMQPYTMVKDHRTGYETGNVSAVMDGDIDGFIEAFLNMPKGGSATFIE